MNFWRLQNQQELSATILNGQHNQLLMLAALLLSIMAAWVLLPVSDRYQLSRGKLRRFWLLAGSLAMGLGIWGMHFTSMLAYSLPIPISYDPFITVISILPAMAASAASIILFESAQKSRRCLLLVALCLAVGIGTMHYLGMEAIITEGQMYYVPEYFFSSIGAAFVLALAGLYSKVYLSQRNRVPAFVGLLAGSVVLGLAVSCMHHIAMGATYFTVPDAVAEALQQGAAVLEPDSYFGMSQLAGFKGLLIAIASSTVLLMCLIILGSLADRHFMVMAASLQKSELRFQKLAESTQMAIFTFNREYVTYANPALHNMLGYSQEELFSLPLRTVLGDEFADMAKVIFDAEGDSPQSYCEQFEVRNRSGQPCWLYCSVTLTEQEDELSCMASGCDVSEQKKAERTLRKLAYSDQLTGLGNRALFMERLRHHLELQSRRKVKSNSCVMVLDLDNFKLLNDTYGHMTGDKLLKVLAQRLRPLARDCDTICRFGGDEFVILLEEMNSHNNVNVIAERIMQNFKAGIELDDKIIKTKCSIGIVLLGQRDYSYADQILHDADIALTRAKQEGGSCWRCYDFEIDSRVKRTRRLKKELEEAIYEKKLLLHYQPIFGAAEHNLQGFEALARWRRESGEWVSPGEFIPIAEEHQLIGDISMLVMDTVCQQIAQWNSEFPARHFYISINVAADSFDDDRFISVLANNIRHYCINPGQLKLELTERMLVSDDKDILDKLNQLIGLGCELMIDDFGTGYSSLAYLHKLPVSTLKIDRSFVMELFEQKDSRSVVTSIIALAKSLSMQVISEGVETREQAELLFVLGTDQIQGFYLGRPAPQEQSRELLQRAGLLAAEHIQGNVVNLK